MTGWVLLNLLRSKYSVHHGIIFGVNVITISLQIMISGIEFLKSTGFKFHGSLLSEHRAEVVVAQIVLEVLKF